MDRYKFAFTMRDSPSDYVNVTCWGSETYIRSLVDSFKICDVGKPVCVHSYSMSVMEGIQLYMYIHVHVCVSEHA